jgi:hypothetical protein
MGKKTKVWDSMGGTKKGEEYFSYPPPLSKKVAYYLLISILLPGTITVVTLLICPYRLAF